jgi:hypothetical protein
LKVSDLTSFDFQFYFMADPNGPNAPPPSPDYEVKFDGNPADTLGEVNDLTSSRRAVRARSPLSSRHPFGPSAPARALGSDRRLESGAKRADRAAGDHRL